MMRGMMCLLALGIALCLTGCSKETATEPENNQTFDGTWVLSSSTIIGEPREDRLIAAPSALEFVFQGDTLNCMGTPCTYRVDPTVEPMTIDILPVGGGAAFMGIARWQNGKLQLCISAKGQPRPNAFDKVESPITKDLLLLSRK
ncbi:MAG: hypothetical protein AB7K24_19485 [Gemmataceae bacterium]